MVKKVFRYCYLGLILAFLYIPFLRVIVSSFNGGEKTAVMAGKWGGFSLRWYQDLFTSRASESVFHALYITILVAVIAAILSTILGTLAAIGIHGMRKRPQNLISNITYIPVINPEIVTGVSLMVLMTALSLPRGLLTMILAHITFDVPYVIFSVLPKLNQMDSHLYEAALDLGATPWVALRKVILPEIRPGIITGAIFAFTLSFDDFVISFFTASASGVDNLSMYIYSELKVGISPRINALMAIIFVAILTLLIIVNKRSADELY